MKDEDLEIAREVEGAQSVLVIRSRTKTPGKWWLLGASGGMAAIAFFICREILAAWFRGDLPHLAITLSSLALSLLCLAFVGWHVLLGFFGIQEVRVGRRTVTSAMRAGRLGRTRRFAVGTQRPVALVDKTETEVGGKPQFGVALYDEPDSKDNPFRRMFKRLDPQALASCLRNWLDVVREGAAWWTSTARPSAAAAMRSMAPTTS